MSQSSNAIAIVVASQQPNSQSRRIADHINAEFLAGKADIIDLHQQELPFWDGSPANDVVQKVKAQAAAADAFVFVVPEWHGMAPAALKNFFLWNGPAELAHKPVLLVAVSSGVGGALVIAELRGSGYKNSRQVYLPDHLIFRDVKNLWSGIKDRDSDNYLSKRTQYSIDQLQAYTTALKTVRPQLQAGLADYPNGMS